MEIEQTTKQSTQLHEDKFFKVFWDESTRIIGIDWKEATSAMTDEGFKTELKLTNTVILLVDGFAQELVLRGGS